MELQLTENVKVEIPCDENSILVSQGLTDEKEIAMYVMLGFCCMLGTDDKERVTSYVESLAKKGPNVLLAGVYTASSKGYPIEAPVSLFDFNWDYLGVPDEALKS